MLKTVKVRIAVAVDPSGAWNSCGWSKAEAESSEEHDAETMGLAVDPLDNGEVRYWIEADIPLPEANVIIGVVEAA